MDRDVLYRHYRNYYVPNNAVLVVVGDVSTADVVHEAERRFGKIPAREVVRPPRRPEPPQIGERRVMLEREGTTAYLKVAYPAPALRDPSFPAALVLDAVLTGAKGVSLWSSFRGKAPQRRSRLYRSLGDSGLASSISGALLPTRDPYLYTISATAANGVGLDLVEEATLGEIERLRTSGATEAEVARARRQLRTRMVFDADSVTSLAHQLGYFETIDGGEFFCRLPRLVEQVTAAEVTDAAQRLLAPSAATIGWFKPRLAA
jgi:zinc protease